MATVFTKDAATRIVAATRQVEEWQGTGTRRLTHGPRPTYQAPQGGMRMGIIVGFRNLADRFVDVVEPVFNDSDPWDGGWIIPTESASQVWCWPPLKAEDFTDFVQDGSDLNDDSDYLPVFRYKGVWFIDQHPYYGYSPYPADARFGDCWATGGMP